MNKSLIVVSSITYAIKGRDILFRYGIKAYVERIKRTKETGCGYGLYIPARTDEAVKILNCNGIKILRRVERGHNT